MFINSKIYLYPSKKENKQISRQLFDPQEPQNSAYNGISIKTPTNDFVVTTLITFFLLPIVNATRNA